MAILNQTYYSMKQIVLFAFLALLCSRGLQAQNEKFKALFIYNFTKYLDWPAGFSQGDFVIGILGSTAIEDELKIIAQKKQVGNMTIVISHFNTPESVTKCHLLFIPSSKSDNLGTITGKFGKTASIIITDEQGLAQKGSDINFVVKEGKQNFEINKTNILGKGLKIDPALLNLGIVIQ